MDERWKRILFYTCALLFVMVAYIGMIERQTRDRLLSVSDEIAGMTEEAEPSEAGSGQEAGVTPEAGSEQSGDVTPGAGSGEEADSTLEAGSMQNGEDTPEAGSLQKEKADGAGKMDTVQETDTAQETESETALAKEHGEEGSIRLADWGEDPSIRVLVCSDNYSYNYHSQVQIGCTSGFTLQYGGQTEHCPTSRVLDLAPDSEYLADGPLSVVPDDPEGQILLPGLARAKECPQYFGKMEIRAEDGGLLVINELSLETYLCGVVPSEMPASYPLEALKAQAVCARTYALKNMESGRASEYYADVDDSVAYQVYNNNAPDDRSTQAVHETEGQVLVDAGGRLVDALYYSTSCGRTMQEDLSSEAVFCAFMDTGGTKAYEASETWYRWQTYFSADELTRLAESWQGGIGPVTGLKVVERLFNGSVLRLLVSGQNGSFEVEGEYSVRKFLSPLNTAVTAQDGYEAAGMSLLPSAFFYLIPETENDILSGYTLKGGGYGHGIGLSQNGAKNMAEAGLDYRKILGAYYEAAVQY